MHEGHLEWNRLLIKVSEKEKWLDVLKKRLVLVKEKVIANKNIRRAQFIS